MQGEMERSKGNLIFKNSFLEDAVCHCQKRWRLMFYQTHGSVSGCCDSQWEPGAVTAPRSVLGTPAGVEQTLHTITHLLGRLRVLSLQEPSGSRSRAALRCKGLDLLYFLCISCVAPMVRVKIILLTCSCFQLTGAVTPGTAGSDQCSDGQCGTGCSVWPQALVAGWHKGASNHPSHHSGWVVPQSTSLTQHKPYVFLSSLMWNNSSSSTCALLCWWLKSAVLNPVQNLQASLELGEVTHCPASHCLWSTSCGQTSPDLTFDRFTQQSFFSLSSRISWMQHGKSQRTWQHHFVLICVLLSVC